MKDIISRYKNIYGAVSIIEGIAIHELVKQYVAPVDGFCADLGSFMGKSSYAAISALDGKRDFLCVEPFVNKEIHINLSGLRYGLHCVDPIDFLENEKRNKFAYLFIDGDHEYSYISRQVKTIMDNDMIVNGGIVLFHDFHNQYSGPEQAYNDMIAGGYKNINIDWEQYKTIMDNNGVKETENSSWHCYQDCNYIMFIGGVIKQ